MPKVIPFTGTLANAGENGKTTVLLGDIVDQLHDKNSFAYPCAAEEADFTAAGIRCKEVNNLDSGCKGFDFGRLLLESRGGAVDWQLFLVTDRTHLVNRLADNVHNAAEGLPPDRHD